LPFHQKRTPKRHQMVMRAALVMMGEMKLVALVIGPVIIIERIDSLPIFHCPRGNEFAESVSPYILVDSDCHE
jgi:hypothetical protein